ncbi:MAG: WG repeat-containing protein [Bacteroidota bacterium]
MKHPLAILLLLSLALAQDILIAVKKDNKWGYVNPSETFVIPAKYDDAWPFYDGKAAVAEGTTYGLINTKGEWIFKAEHGGIVNGDLTNKRFVCSTDQGKWGATDLKGKTIVNFQFDAMSPFQYGMAITGIKTTNADLIRINVVDTLGKQIITNDNIYLPAKSLSQGKKIHDGYVSVLVDGDYSKALKPSGMKLDGKDLYYALLDVRSKQLVNLKINSLNDEVREGRFNLSVDGISYSWSIPLRSEPAINEAKFNFLSPALYPFSSGIAAVQKDGKWAFVDKDGSIISETNLPASDYINDSPLYSGGFVIFKKKNGEYIYTDLKGVQRIAMEFEEVNPFQLGAAVVKLKGKYGLVQKDGTWALQPTYDLVRY